MEYRPQHTDEPDFMEERRKSISLYALRLGTEVAKALASRHGCVSTHVERDKGGTVTGFSHRRSRHR